MKTLHIFKAGKQTAMSGQQIDFSESHLQAAVAAYDPAVHEAPIVIGHPKTDDPAYGWVQSISHKNGDLFAVPTQVNPVFSEQVEAGAFKKISASFYSPDSPNNPVKGVYYLRHVGFLGAQPPAVKGLKAVEFSEADECVTVELDFSEAAVVDKSLTVFDAMKRLVKFFTLAGVDFSEPEPTATTASTSISDPSSKPDAKAPETEPTKMTDPNPKDTDMTEPTSGAPAAPTQAELDAANQRAAQLQAKLDAKEEADAKKEADEKAKANADFAEGLVNNKKLQPADKLLVEAMLNALGNTAEPVNFGEGGSEKPLIDVLKDKLSNAPSNSVLFSEAATKPTHRKTTAGVNVPAGEDISPEDEANHKAIVDYSEKHDMSYIEAASALSDQL